MTPLLRTFTQYRPYPPNIASTTSMAIAPQNRASAGGARPPSAVARPVNSTALIPAWIARPSTMPAVGRVRRSTSVAATSDSIAANGSAYAHSGTSGLTPRSPPTTSATPTRPTANPAICRTPVGSPSSGTARATATTGCNALISAVVPAGTPCPAAANTPYR